MPRIFAQDRPVVHTKVRLYKEDVEALRRMVRPGTSMAKIIRTVIHFFVLNASENARKEIDKLVDLDDDDPGMAEAIEEIAKDIIEGKDIVKEGTQS